MASSGEGLNLAYLLGTTIGCGLVGAIVSQFLYGLSLAQAAYYFWIYSEDPSGLKWLVVWWILLDTIKEAISIQVLYEDLIINHANLESVSHLSIAYGAQNVLGWILVLSVHCFYIHNMRKLLKYNRRRKLLSAVALALAVLTCVTNSAVIDYAIYYKGKFHHIVRSLSPLTKIQHRVTHSH
ncbi:hypothetical protein C8Q72DRAFT_631086 [Fomitopsis betulina]|nr:hypothetical protein C8Q72DRAFT_631086 [Fomitopsis betulina]